ncbi:MAG: phage integrase N-terminal SAM-like domain-containing protein [Planctomycetota bacterium]
MRRCWRFHGLERLEDLGNAHIGPFLDHLATERQVGASTQRQALCAPTTDGRSDLSA